MSRPWWKRWLCRVGLHVGCCWYKMSDDERRGRGLWSGAPPDEEDVR